MLFWVYINLILAVITTRTDDDREQPGTVQKNDIIGYCTVCYLGQRWGR